MDHKPTDRASVVAVGHAIVDVLARCDDAFVVARGLTKGTMTLIEDDEAERLYASLGPATEASGGSAANTAACLASLGVATTFVGKVANDTLGSIFIHDIRRAGVSFDVEPVESGPGTGRCLIMVTPDGERTMCTNLGIGSHLSASDIDADRLGAAGVLYVEGYLYGKQPTSGAVESAVEAAHRGGSLVAFSASDPAWVELNLAAISELIGKVDLLFANEAEALLLSGQRDLDSAVAVLAARCPEVAITLGERGCVAVTKSEKVHLPAAPVDRVVDTTGAGDSFAAGYLFGVVNGFGPEKSARIGAAAAAEVISHMGARPLSSLPELLKGERLI
jgi:sugar/nucleoside kinase (ribokinase family)